MSEIILCITTTPERKDVFEENFKKWVTFLPSPCRVFVYIDADHKGVSHAKNRCLAVCTGAEHIFCVDDDIFPTSLGWFTSYINSGLNHACWNYNRRLLFIGDTYVEYEKPNGCFLYFKKICLEKAGGWDIDFKGYGYEHCNLSDRIFNLGLTPARYIDIPNSGNLFQMADCPSSFSAIDRAWIPKNYELYMKNYNSKEFKPFQ